MGASAIGDYALLSDCRSAALVSPDGSVDWWPAPRFDSPALLARVLDDDAGHFSIRPAGRFESSRRYVGRSLVCETRFAGAGGTLVLTDALAFEPRARGHRIGLASPNALVRVAEATAGDVDVEVELAVRPEYGLVVPELVRRPDGLETLGGAQRVRLVADRPLAVEGRSARARFRLRDGERAAFVLRLLPPEGAEPELPDAGRLLRETAAGWESWAALHGGYDGPFADDVARSSLVLQGLTYQPTGAVVAAPTTSLPERLGGDRNWDYRYGWLRDASLVARALRTATCSDEATRYFGWMTRAAVTCRASEHVQIVYGVAGERELPERSLEHLSGHRGSAPVRVGNAAWRQKQLDVLGEVLDVAALLEEELPDAGPHVPPLLRQLADRAASQWREPDAGIWEAREREAHFVFSKAMCWVALDRALALAGFLGREADTARWARERDAVRAAVLDHGFDEERGAFMEAFGSPRLDASALLLPQVGFVRAADPRMRRTAERLEQELGAGGLLHRWSGAGEVEGAFLPASLWLAECHAAAGEPERAAAIVERVCAVGGDLGLLAEEADPATGEPLGNVPQALTHVALVNAVTAIGRAERRTGRAVRAAAR